MEKTTVTFRTNQELKEQASALFESLGMNLTTAINMFLVQSVRKQKYPCALDLDIAQQSAPNYPAEFFALFGTGNGLGFDEEPEELPMDGEELAL